MTHVVYVEQRNDRYIQSEAESPPACRRCAKSGQTCLYGNDLRGVPELRSVRERKPLEGYGNDEARLDPAFGGGGDEVPEVIYALGVGLIWFALWALLR